MTKLFISQPMNSRTNDEIKEERDKIIATVKKTYNDLEVLESFFKDVPHDAKPLWYLGESIKLLSEADIVVFAKGWNKARGCKIEHQCAVDYGKKIVIEY